MPARSNNLPVNSLGKNFGGSIMWQPRVQVATTTSASHLLMSNVISLHILFRRSLNNGNPDNNKTTTNRRN